MTYLLRKTGFLALVAVLSCALSAAAQAQTPPNRSGMDQERAKELANLMGQLHVTSLILSFRQSMEQRRDLTDDEGRMLNAVIVADPDQFGSKRTGSPFSGESSAEPSYGSHDCINPPAEKRARYTAAYLNVAPRMDGYRGQIRGYKLDEKELAPSLAKEFMPPKLEEGQPGVLILVNRGDGDFAYHLDDAWPDREAARRWIDGELGDNVDDDNAVCEVSNTIEELLSRAQTSSITELLRGRHLERTLDEVAGQIDGIRQRIERDAADTGLYEEQMRGELERATDQMKRAKQRLQAGELDHSAQALGRAEEAISSANSTYLAIMSLQNEARQTRKELDTFRDETELRRVHFLPSGEKLDSTYQTCEARFATFSERAHAGNSIEDTRAAKAASTECFDRLRTLRTETQGRFDTYVFYLPIGGGVGGTLLFLILLSVRVNSRQTLKYRLNPALSEWDQLVPMFERRLQRMKRKYAGILNLDEAGARSAGLSQQDIDTIDRAFALTARAAEVLDEAHSLQREASLANLSPLEDCLTLLEQDTSELTASNTTDTTPIGRGLREDEAVAHSDLLQVTDQLTQEASSVLSEHEASGDQDGSW